MISITMDNIRHLQQYLDNFEMQYLELKKKLHDHAYQCVSGKELQVKKLLCVENIHLTKATKLICINTKHLSLANTYEFWINLSKLDMFCNVATITFGYRILFT